MNNNENAASTASTPTKVSYFHLKGYRVSRVFDSREAAQQFVDVNAMVFPLPGVIITDA